MVTFSSRTLPLLNLRNKFKMLQVKYSNNKSSAIFIDKGRNRFNYSSPYTLGKFAILNRFTFLGTLTFKKVKVLREYILHYIKYH